MKDPLTSKCFICKKPCTGKMQITIRGKNQPFCTRHFTKLELFATQKQLAEEIRRLKRLAL